MSQPQLMAALGLALEGRSAFRVTDIQGQVFHGPWDNRREETRRYCGQPVFWPMKNQPDAISDLLQALAEGVIPVLLPAGLPAAKLAHLQARYPHYGIYLDGQWQPASCRVDAAEELLFCLLTSGSTGQPKVIATSAQAISQGVAFIHSAQQLEDCQGTAVTLPLAYSYAFVNQLLWALQYQRQLLLTAGWALPSDTLALIRQQPVDLLCLVAQQAESLARLGAETETRLEQIRWVNFAGSPFPNARLAGLQRLFPQASFFNNYGCTEAMPRLTVRPIDSEPTAAGDVGAPIGDIQLRIVDSSGQSCAEGESGAIQFRGSSASLGVLDAEGRLQPHGDWIASGDQGRLLDGQLQVLGRADQVVKVGGERLSLLEVEQALLAQGLSQVYVCQPQPDEGLVAVLGGARRPALRPLLRQVRQQLPAAAMPRRLFWAESWPLLANQKTDREQLRRWLEEDRLEALS